MTTYRLDAFANVGLDESSLKLAIDAHIRGMPRMNQLWAYYRNPLQPARGLGWAETSRVGRWYRQSQERGLPTRIVGCAGTTTGSGHPHSARREVVIENDIAWRVQAMVDFMFGKPVSMVSTASDATLRRTIERVLDKVWESSGGIGLLQDAALLGHVFGHVDLLLRVDELGLRAATERARRNETSEGSTSASDEDLVLRASESIRIEVIEPRRGIAILDEHDYRKIKAYIIHYVRDADALQPQGLLERLLPRFYGSVGSKKQRFEAIEVISPHAWHAYENGTLVWEQQSASTSGDLPVVHIQNLSQPFEFEGLGEVEGLIPLQDELNTRLSDRASRVTLQNFKMYLAKGIDGFEKMPVGPGQLISTDNPDASIEEFGGDTHSPSEEAHIQQVRDALDKASGIPPIASGVVQAKIGNLSSANALRITLMGVLSKTARKRVTYGSGIARMCALILRVLDTLGVLATREQDRGIRLTWPDPLPEDVREQVMAAEAKSKLGVPTERVLAELGYSPTDPGIS